MQRRLDNMVKGSNCIKKGEHLSRETEFKKGMTPHNRGIRKYGNIELWKGMYLKDKKSTCKIGKEIGIDSATIYKRLKEEGVELRTKREASTLSIQKGRHIHFEKGNIPHNKGKTKENYEPIMRRSKKRERKDINEKNDYIIDLYLNKKKSQVEIGKMLKCDFTVINRILKENEVRIRPQSFYVIGKEGKRKGETYEESFGKKRAKEIKKKLVKARSKQIFPLKNSSIELKIQDFLTALRIEFATHKYMNIKNAYQCDIFIPVQEGISQKTVVECDGDFFHMNPDRFSSEDKIFKKSMTAKERWQLDESRTQQLIEKGYRVLRMWENEIKEITLKEFEGKLNCLIKAR